MWQAAPAAEAPAGASAARQARLAASQDVLLLSTRGFASRLLQARVSLARGPAGHGVASWRFVPAQQRWRRRSWVMQDAQNADRGRRRHGGPSGGSMRKRTAAERPSGLIAERSPPWMPCGRPQPCWTAAAMFAPLRSASSSSSASCDSPCWTLWQPRALRSSRRCLTSLDLQTGARARRRRG